MIIKYSGGTLAPPTLQIPGWAGKTTENSYQPWHSLQFTSAATTGVELVFPYDDTTVPDISPPFTCINDLFYLMEMELNISTPDKTSLLVLPHYRFYTDAEWSTPIPVATSLETDWWIRLIVMFKMPPKGYVTKFRKNEPFAQAVVIPRSSLKVELMTEKEVERNQTAKLYTQEEGKKLITREWVTSSGYVQNNLYEVLSHLEKQGKLPEQIKPKKRYKLI